MKRAMVETNAGFFNKLVPPATVVRQEALFSISGYVASIIISGSIRLSR
jgi:hypothetical protein